MIGVMILLLGSWTCSAGTAELAAADRPQATATLVGPPKLRVEAFILVPPERNSPNHPGQLVFIQYRDRRIIVPGTTAIEGKTFRYGIKGSSETSASADESTSTLVFPPGAPGVVVAKYTFDLEEIPGTGGPGRPPATRWVGWSNSSEARDEEPGEIDEAHSGLPQPLRASSEAGGA